MFFCGGNFAGSSFATKCCSISVDMNKITCGRWLGYSPEERDFVRFWMSGYYNSAANSKILNYDRFQRNSAKVAGYCESAQVPDFADGDQKPWPVAGIERTYRQTIGKGWRYLPGLRQLVGCGAKRTFSELGEAGSCGDLLRAVAFAPAG